MYETNPGNICCGQLHYAILSQRVKYSQTQNTAASDWTEYYYSEPFHLSQ